MAAMYVKPVIQIVPLVLFAIYVCFATKPPKAGVLVMTGRPYFETALIY